MMAVVTSSPAFPLQDAKTDDAEGDASLPKPTRHRRAKDSKEDEKTQEDTARSASILI